jgi:siroheme synthase (precorrin-2 oxidase/ferrochelatase)
LRIFPKKTKKTFPNKAHVKDCAVIKLKKFKNLPVAIIVDNGGLSVSYDTTGLSPADCLGIKNEIETIISVEMDKIIEEET